MSTPVIIVNFGPNGQPFNLDTLNNNFAAMVAAINALSVDTVLQLGVTPGNLGGYLPITGGTLHGQISAPSVLVGPVGGAQYPVLTDQGATPVVNLTQAITTPTSAEVLAIQNKVNELLAMLRTMGVLPT